MSADELKQVKSNQLKFSRNAVCVDLSGPQLADLAFVDLPGIIQNADEDIVKLVEDLVLSHIKGNCLILVALPMSDDMENQKAMRLAREADMFGLRTIGVLTKPDLVTTAQKKQSWLDVVEGRSYPLKHGYYCTRQPDEDERARGISPAEARVEEADFFLTKLPWTTSAHQSRFGTQNLVSNLSRLLSKVIDERLPTLSIETKRQLGECDSRLAALPAPITSEPSSFVLGLVTSFCADVKSHIQGQSLATNLVQETRRTYKTFQRDIRATAPPFLPYADKKTKHDMSKVQDLLQLDDEKDGDAQFVASFKEYIYLHDVRDRINRAITRELPNNVPYPAKVTFIQDFQKTWDDHVRTCEKAVYREMQDTIARLITSKFGPYVHLQPRLTHIIQDLVEAKYKVVDTQLSRLLRYETSPFTQNEHYLSASKEKFLVKYKAARANPASAPKLFMDAQKQRGDNVVSNNSPSWSLWNAPSPWKQFPRTYRYDSPGTTSEAFTVQLYSEQLHENAAILHYCSISAMPIYRNWSFEELRATDYADRRPLKPNASSLTPAQSAPAAAMNTMTPTSSITMFDRKQEEDNILAGLARLGFTGLSAADLSKLRPVDDFEEELEVMAEVRAYFKVTYKRIIDYVPLAIDHEFLYSFAEDLQDFLIEKLGLGSKDAAEKCAAYLAEDPHIVATREELLSRKRRLEKVQEQLLNFGL